MLKYDLHCHSTRSDGVLQPRELVARAAERGVDVLALTDHDEVSGLAEARCAAVETGIRFVDGVEISVDWNGCTLHIVGLGIDPNSAELVEGLESIRAGRRFWGSSSRIIICSNAEPCTCAWGCRCPVYVSVGGLEIGGRGMAARTPMDWLASPE